MSYEAVESMEQLGKTATYSVFGHEGQFRFKKLRSCNGERFAVFASVSEGYEITAYGEDFAHGCVVRL